MSRVRVSVRPSNFFIREKHPKSRGNRFETKQCSNPIAFHLSNGTNQQEDKHNRESDALKKMSFLSPYLRKDIDMLSEV